MRLWPIAFLFNLYCASLCGGDEVARVIKCFKKCEVIIGQRQAQLSSRSRLFQGDEVFTQEKGIMWLALRNGQMLRLSPKTSISLLGLYRKDNVPVVSIRLNYGHLYIHSTKRPKRPINLKETDQVFLPLPELKSNREYYMRQEYEKVVSDPYKRSMYLMEPNPGAIGQFKALNRVISSNAKHGWTFITSSHYQLINKGSNIHLAHLLNSNAYIECSAECLKADIAFHHDEKLLWKKLSSRAVELTEQGYNEVQSPFFSHKKAVARIFSIELANEYMRKKYFKSQVNTTDFIIDRVVGPYFKNEKKHYQKLIKRFEKTQVKMTEFMLEEELYLRSYRDVKDHQVLGTNLNDFFIWVLMNEKKSSRL